MTDPVILIFLVASGATLLELFRWDARRKLSVRTRPVRVSGPFPRRRV